MVALREHLWSVQLLLSYLLYALILLLISPLGLKDAKMGSVGVRQADMARLERKLRPGIKP